MNCNLDKKNRALTKCEVLFFYLYIKTSWGKIYKIIVPSFYVSYVTKKKIIIHNKIYLKILKIFNFCLQNIYNKI